MRRSVVALSIVVAVLAHAGTACAQETVQCEQRLTPITTALDDDARHTRVWYWSWMAAGTALVAGQAALAAVTTGDLRNDSILGSASAVFIPAFLLIHPPEVLSDAPRLDARLAKTAVDGRVGDPCIALQRARELLARDAADEGFAKAWYAHAFVIGGNIALGLILGVGFGDWLGFAKQAVGGSIVGELQIWTLPGGALQARGLGFGGTF
jgi:hypothetical protein